MSDLEYFGEFEGNWFKCFDPANTMFYYWNSTTQESKWTIEEVKPKIEKIIRNSSDDFIEGNCEECKGFGKDLISRYTKLCGYCEKALGKRLSFGPCIVCKGYGRNLVGEDGLCSFCRRIHPNKGKSVLEVNLEAKEEAGINSKLKSFKDKKFSTFDRLILQQQQRQKKDSKSEDLQLDSITPEMLAKRKRPDLTNRKVDPLDPNGRLKTKNSDILASLTKAADETVTGTLFQSRPYPNPGKVLNEMTKKTKMY